VGAQVVPLGLLVDSLAWTLVEERVTEGSEFVVLGEAVAAGVEYIGLSLCPWN
jgi:hypothetical protein